MILFLELASSCISICYWGLSFIAGKTFQDITDSIGYRGVYYLSSAICMVGAVFVFFLVPETKGKSSDEIQQFFITRKLSNATESERKARRTPVDEGVDNPSFVNQDVNVA